MSWLKLFFIILVFITMYPHTIETLMIRVFNFDKFVFHDFLYVAWMILNLIFFIAFVIYTVPFIIHHIIVNNFGYNYYYIYPFMLKLELFFYNILLKIFITLLKHFYSENIDDILNSKINSAKKQNLLWDFFYFRIIFFILTYILLLFTLIKIFGIRNLSSNIMEHICKYKRYYRIFIIVIIILLWTVVQY